MNAARPKRYRVGTHFKDDSDGRTCFGFVLPDRGTVPPWCVAFAIEADSPEAAIDAAIARRIAQERDLAEGRSS